MAGFDEQAQSDQAFLRGVWVRSFTANPNALLPLEQSTLAWDVSVPEHHPPIRLALQGSGLEVAVAASGSRRVAPVFSSSYTLRATLPRATRVLATQAVQVDTSDCMSFDVPESDLVELVTEQVDKMMTEEPELRRRRVEQVEVRYDGAHLSIRLVGKFPDQPNPDINVDGSLQFYAEGGQLRYRLTRYSFDIDFEWYVDLLSYQFFPAWLALALAENNQDALVRGNLIDGIEAFVAEQQRRAGDAGHEFLFVRALLDRFEVTLCPIREPTSHPGLERPSLAAGPGESGVVS